MIYEICSDIVKRNLKPAREFFGAVAVTHKEGVLSTTKIDLQVATASGIL